MAEKEDVEKAQGLEKLVTEFGEIVGLLAENIQSKLQTDGNESDATIAETLKSALLTQTSALTGAISQAMGSLSDDSRKTMDKRADETGGLTILRMTRRSMATRSVDLSGIIELLEPIKKIINLIIDLLKKLGVSSKIIDWIEYLLPFINNLLEILNGLLGREAGLRAARATSMMHRHIQEFYQTQTARRLYERVVTNTPEPDEPATT